MRCLVDSGGFEPVWASRFQISAAATWAEERDLRDVSVHERLVAEHLLRHLWEVGTRHGVDPSWWPADTADVVLGAVSRRAMERGRPPEGGAEHG